MAGGSSSANAGEKLLTVEEYAALFFKKFLQEGFASSHDEAGGGNDRNPSAARSNESKAQENHRRACERFTDLLRKISQDKELLKVPLRCLRDEILRADDDARKKGDTSKDVDALFGLFDGVHQLCKRLASRGAAGPYATVEQAIRLRLYLCVAGDTWADRPTLRAKALKHIFRFFKEEAQEESTPEAAQGDAEQVTGRGIPGARNVARGASFGSIPISYFFGNLGGGGVKDTGGGVAASGRSENVCSSVMPTKSSWLRMPSKVHSMVNVSSWQAVVGELVKVSSAKMVPVVIQLLDDLHAVETSRVFAVSPGAVPTPVTTPPLGRDEVPPSFIDLRPDNERYDASITDRAEDHEVRHSREAGNDELLVVDATLAASSTKTPDGWESFEAPLSNGSNGTGIGIVSTSSGANLHSGRYPLPNPFSQESPMSSAAAPEPNMTQSEFEELMKHLAD